MDDRWMIRGPEYGNCNCAWGCPCQFNAPTTHGFCQAVVAGVIEEGHFNDTRLDGLRWVWLLQWPGEVAEGNGRQQLIIDERADSAQREGLRKIIHGESTAPGSTHFYVYASTMAEFLETLYAPMEVEIDIEARHSRVSVPGLVELRGDPIIDPNSGEEFRAGIHLPNGFEYSFAEIGNGSARAQAGLEVEHTDSYGQFCMLHMNQDGVIR